MAGSNATTRGVPRRILQGDGPTVPVIGAGQIPTIQYSAGSARALQQFSRDLFSLSDRYEDQRDQQVEAEAKTAGALAGATGDFELQNYGTIRGRAFNQAAVETFASNLDTQSVVKLQELQSQFWNDPAGLQDAWNNYRRGVGQELSKVSPAQAAAYDNRTAVRGLGAIEQAKDTAYKLTRSEADAALINNEAAMRAEIKENAADLFSQNPERSSAAARSIQMLRNDFMRIYRAVDPTTGKPLYTPEEIAKASKQLQDTVTTNATLSWFDEQPDKAGAYMKFLSGDFKFKLQTGNGYQGRLPAGMRNNNPGNIKYVGQSNSIGPSENTDQGDPQAVYATAEDGMSAMFQLLSRKYQGGKVTPNQMIAEKGGWTPGNYQAAANVARSAGIGPDDDINLGDQQSAFRFMRALMAQEHGKASAMYSDEMVLGAISGNRTSEAAIGTDLRGVDQVGNAEFSVLDALSPTARDNLDAEMRSRISFTNALADREADAVQKRIVAEQDKNAFDFTSRIYAAGAVDPTTGQPVKPLTREEVLSAGRNGLLKPGDGEAIIKALTTERPTKSDETTLRNLQNRVYAGEDIYRQIIDAGSKLTSEDAGKLLSLNQSQVRGNQGEFNPDQKFYFNTLSDRLGQTNPLAPFDQGKADRRAQALDEYRRRVLDPQNADSPSAIADDIASRATSDFVAMDQSALSRKVMPRYSVPAPTGGNRLDIKASAKALQAAYEAKQLSPDQYRIEQQRLIDWKKLQDQVERAQTTAPKGK